MQNNQQRNTPALKGVALRCKALYSNTVQCKIIGLAVEGYNSVGAQTAFSGFFVHKISMRSRISMAKLERDTFTCTGFLLSLSSNPFQLCHSHIFMYGKASFKSFGVNCHV